MSCVSQVMHHKLYNLETSYADISYERMTSSSGSHHKSYMYRKIMIQIYLLEDVCKKLYLKVVLRHYNFLEKIMWTKKPF